MAALCLVLPSVLGQGFGPFDRFGPRRSSRSRRFGESGESRRSRDFDRFYESGESSRHRYNRSSLGVRGDRRSRYRGSNRSRYFDR